jgi:predicted enzyme related to lactoylglutathione lyase
MNMKSIDLAWIVVKDLKKAIEFYTEIVGLKLMESNEQFGWAELEGPSGGARLGICAPNSNCPKESPFKAGQNAVVTFTVKSLDKAIAECMEKGAKLLGTMEEVPGHVKMQTVVDTDGNAFQFVEVLTCQN